MRCQGTPSGPVLDFGDPNDGEGEAEGPTLMEYMALNSRLADGECGEFVRTFGVSLAKYWSNLTGFDIVGFDRNVVESGDDERMIEVVRARWGDGAVAQIRRLIRTLENALEEWREDRGLDPPAR